MRFTHHGPQYDIDGQASNFFPDLWSGSAAPSLYTPGCSVAKSPCPSANRVAVNPSTGVAEGPAVAIGTLVPNTGDALNGIIQAGHGDNPIENYKEDPMVFGPRVGGAYDLHGDQKIVLRGSFGVFYDRLQGDSIFGQIGNPPTGQSATVYYNTLQNVAAGANALVNTPTLVIYRHDAKIGAAASWNAGVQMQLPWSSALDVSYVGTHNYNSVAFGSISTPGGHQPIDLNAPDLGTAYLPQYQDPTLAASQVPGATAVTANLMRPYPGYGAIVQTWPRFYTQYDSIQTSLNRRFSHGWSAGVSWTLGLRLKGDTLSELHLQHNADGTIAISPVQAEDDAVITNVGLRRRILKAHFTWDLPDFEGASIPMRALGLLASGWQLSGVFTGDSGAPYDATFSYQRDGSNTNLTGSPNYTARIKMVGDPGSGCSSNQYQQFDPSAFQGPAYGSTGNESGANLLTGCSDHTLDLTIARTIALGGSRTIQIRLDAFNVTNALVYNGRSTAIQYNSPADPTTIRNFQYNPDGSINTARLTPKAAGAGAATGAQSLRTMQLQVRFGF
jgi:hypothetical protein